MRVLGGGERWGAHRPGTTFAVVLDNLGCLLALLWGCLFALQFDLTAGFAGLQGWVLQEMGRGFSNRENLTQHTTHLPHNDRPGESL